MHQIIRTILYANNEIEALSKAKEVFEKLCGDGKPFDYYVTFDDDTVKSSGKARWGKLPTVCLVDSKEGKKLIKEGMKYTKEEFFEYINKIKNCVEQYSDKELFEEKQIKGHREEEKVIEKLSNELEDISMFKYYCSCCGQFTGNKIYLYDDDGEGIRNDVNLKDVLSKWKCIYEDKGKENPYANKKCFVVPADVHY